jgi:hypothetical protein
MADVGKAIEDVKEMRATHVYWAEYLATWAVPAATVELVGNQAEHEELVVQYDNILGCLQAAR